MAVLPTFLGNVSMTLVKTDLDIAERYVALAPYTLRLHFAETTFNNAGQRRFNVYVNGSSYLSNFDILAYAGGKNRAAIVETPVVSSLAGVVTVQFTVGTADQPTINGIAAGMRNTG